MNIIITGASRGIGYELVKILSKEPSFHVMAISRDATALSRLKDECSKSLGKIDILPWDLSEPDKSTALVKEIIQKMDSVDILINNAGAIVNKPFMELSSAETEEVYRVNVFAVISLIQNVLPHMGKERKGHIVNISSMGGFQGTAKFAGLSAYSSSKAALICLTECLAEELKEKNIAINCLALGAAQTEMLEAAFPGYKAPVTAKEMAEFISEFALKGLNLMNGKIIPVSISTP